MVSRIREGELAKSRVSFAGLGLNRVFPAISPFLPWLGLFLDMFRARVFGGFILGACRIFLGKKSPALQKWLILS